MVVDILCGQRRRVLVITLLVWRSELCAGDNLLATQYADRVTLEVCSIVERGARQPP